LVSYPENLLMSSYQFGTTVFILLGIAIRIPRSTQTST
jgi:hypothetical protein